MSTTTSGPFTPVVRRITPRGSVDLGVPAGGVTHPSTHSAEATPLVGGGLAGVAGGVGDAVGDAGVIGAETVGVALSAGGRSESQPARATPIAAKASTNRENLRNRRPPNRPRPVEDTDGPVP